MSHPSSRHREGGEGGSGEGGREEWGGREGGREGESGEGGREGGISSLTTHHTCIKLRGYSP